MKKRNEYLNVVEAIAAYFVVFIHIMFPGQLGILVKDYGRFAVPLFFSIAGYFYWLNDEKNYLISTKRKIKNLFHILITSEIFYFIWYSILYTRKYGFSISGIFDMIYNQLISYNMINIIATVPLFNGIGWFIGQLIIAYIFWYFVIKKKQLEYVYKTIPILIIMGLFIRQIFYIPFLSFWCFFSSIPFFGIGFWIHDKENCFLKKNYNGYILLSVGFIFQFIEIIIFGHKELYIGTCIIIFGIMMICIKNKNKKTNLKWLNKIGGEYTTFIYIMHPWVIGLIEYILNINCFSKYFFIMKYIYPIISCIVVTILAMCYSHFFKYINKKLLNIK